MFPAYRPFLLAVLVAVCACAGSSTPAAPAQPAATEPAEQPDPIDAEPAITAEEAIMAAVASPGRPDEDVKRDDDRKPAEVLSFFGIRPGMVVADLMAGRGYYTELLARLVGTSGHVYAHNNTFVDQRFAKQPLADRIARMAMDHVTITVQELDQLSFPRPLDAAVMVLFYHDTYWQMVDRKAMNKAIFEALSPGGTFGVIDHYAPVGTGSSVVETLHRIEKEMVIAEILAAGFVLEAESDILRHPDDDRTKNVFDESLRGKTDRFVVRFRKPE